MSATTTSLISTTSATPAPTATNSGNSGNGPSSPLLFFVALGFGVVFTNLWIIVGVKYCFRYNQRNRQRMNGEDPDGVDLGAMPRQHRRRREKKLMTMEEVNEKFPLTKYKSWRASRADEGLPTAGGINTASRPPSRPASVHEQDPSSKDLNDTTEAREPAQTQGASTENEKSTQPEHVTPEVVGSKTAPDSRPDTPSRPKSTQSTMVPDSPVVHKVTTNDEDDDDDDHIQTAVPAEQLPDPGDACAICIDTLDDDDDVRGLECGHAFHASCVDPWLTSRRACCPLCKADYYVPKPRPEGPNGEGLSRSATNPDLPQPPQTTYSIMAGARQGRRPAMYIPGRFMSIVYHDRDRHGFPVVVRAERAGQGERQRERDLSAATTANGDAPETQPQTSTWRSRLTGLRLPGRARPPPTTGTQPTSTGTPEVQPTPSQLEAGR
ncbi:uncharacterized protein A1O9_09480 [Exophiala aquamarina CBS 119918]|uniref:RING-type domain-containing protein n=1 Tax=Exophiala aquamarina CBS 119918 TaxID=1182545 RepID=A0A072P2K4_9EURO|nr:uncharacterized protein A1O9_09480 [Exophiala aquamarina CBS 119918]KEF54314.1 hypothetical protein A1O9_09480 [Exophiala aquamarina CBS 119918]